MKKIDLIVIIPVGPTTNIDFLLDTIESVKYYCGKSQKIILTNDSRKEINLDQKLNLDVVNMPSPMGKQSGLYFSLCSGIKHAIEKYDFKVLLRMDDDALVTGKEPEIEAMEYFNNYPKVGILGSYKMDWQNTKRSFLPPRKQIQIELNPLWRIYNFFRKRKTNSIEPAVTLAVKHGYELGEHILGGVYFMSRALIDKLNAAGQMPSQHFVGSKLEEDHIFGILTYSVNMRLGDFVTANYPMCLKWKGMPTSPQNVLKLGKKVVHSTRYYLDLPEKEVRAIFKKSRK